MSLSAQWDSFRQQVTHALDHNPLAQQVRDAWNQLDQERQNIIKITALATTSILAVTLWAASWWSTHTLQKELTEQRELATLLEMANRIQEPGNTPDTAPSPSDAKSELEGILRAQGIQEFEITGPTNFEPGKGIQESVLDVKIPKTNIRRLSKTLASLEIESKKFRIRGAEISAKDENGYLSARFIASRLTPKR